MGIVFIYVIFQLVELPDDVIIEPIFETRYGLISEGIPDKTYVIGMIYYPLYLIRRLAYVIILILLYKYPLIQIFAIVITNSLPVRLF